MIQAHLRGVIHGGEHGFAEEDVAYSDTVKATNQLPIVPGLHAVSIPQHMKLFISGLHFRRDPGAFSIFGSKTAAVVDHLVEGGIEADLIDSPADRPF